MNKKGKQLQESNCFPFRKDLGMNNQALIDRTLFYHLWQKHPDWSPRQFANTLKRPLDWVREWSERFREDTFTPALLIDRSHTSPDTSPHTTSQEVMETILDLRDHPPASLRRVPGPKAILSYLKQAEHLAETCVPRSTRTIWRILATAGRIISTMREHQERQDRPGPMQEWQMDFKDISTIPPDPDGKKQHAVECLNIIDVGTDILVGARVRSDYKAATVIPEVIAVMQEYGMPVALRFDRDPRFVGSANRGDFPSALVKTLLCLDIASRICDPDRPDQNGVVERYNKTYGEECVAVDSPETEAEGKEVTAAHRQRYNHERPNQSVVCGNQPPCVAHPTLPPPRLLPEMVDPDSWLLAIDGLRYQRKVQADTSITVDHQRYYTRKSLIGKEITVRVDATAKELVIEENGQEVRRVALRGLHNTGPIPLEQVVALRCQEADTEQRRQTYGSRTAKQQRRNARSERWIDRVNGANVRSKQEHKPAEAAAENDELLF